MRVHDTKHKTYIGTSGWSYEHWKDNFYPEKLKSTDWLGYFSTVFNTVEINTTFYHTPRSTTVDNWHHVVPSNFTFSIKMNRYITHIKRLNDCKSSLKIFYNSIKGFKLKTGPILIQLPPSFKADIDRLQDFIGLLKTKYKYTFEFRHESWYCEEIYAILRDNNIALCITDLHGIQSPEVVTADFVYIRLHGPHSAYTGAYGLPKLKVWNKKFEQWSSDASIFCYFDNDDKGYAIKDAAKLQKLVMK